MTSRIPTESCGRGSLAVLAVAGAVGPRVALLRVDVPAPAAAPDVRPADATLPDDESSRAASCRIRWVMADAASGLRPASRTGVGVEAR